MLKEKINLVLVRIAEKIKLLQQDVAKKLDSSAIVNYYTKAETDSVTSGKIDQFNASLKIGGENLVLNSDRYITGDSSVVELVDDFVARVKGQYVILSVDVEYSNAQNMANDWRRRIGFELSLSYADNSTQFVSVWEIPDVNTSSAKKRIYSNPILIKDQDFTLNYRNMYVQFGAGTTAKIERPMLQIGTKATDRTPAQADIDSKIDTNTQAISNQSQQIAQLQKELEVINSKLDKKVDKY